MSYHSGIHLIDPHALLAKARVIEGAHVIDFGCGRTGHVVFPASKIVGERGAVYAVDVLKNVLDSVRKRAMLEAIHNVETVWADLSQSRSLAIPERTADAGFFINMLFHFDSYEIPLSEASRVLKSKSRIVIADWRKKLSVLGPREHEMVDFDRIIAWGRDNDFVVQEDVFMGPYHRALVLFRH